MATGMLEVVNALMERAVRNVSVEQGADPRQAPLLAFGGAGGLHATALARRLDMPAVLIPPHAGVFSALGLLLSPARHDVAHTIAMNQGDPDFLPRVEEIVAEVKAGFRADTGFVAERIEVTADLRYPGQSHETNVVVKIGDSWERLADRFHEAHHIRNGFSSPHQSTELVTLRATAVSRPALEWSSLPLPRPAGEPRLADRVLADGSMVARWWLPSIEPGQAVVGPAVLEDPQSTTWIGSGERAVLLEDGSTEITW
jgi:N-methylhydantoinase A